MPYSPNPLSRKKNGKREGKGEGYTKWDERKEKKELEESQAKVHEMPLFGRQEAQLSPRDRAMRRVNWNLANCHATVQKLNVRQVLNKSKLWSCRVTVGQCVINMCTQPWRDRVASIVLWMLLNNRPRTSCGYHLYTDDLLWRNFLGPQCRNCSRDPDHAHLGNTHSSQD